MKSLFFILLLSSSLIEAKCLEIDTELNIQVKHLKAAVDRESNHPALDTFELIVDSSYQGYSLHSIELTQGEVTNLYIPMEIKTMGAKSSASFIASAELAKSFEVLISYRKGQCLISSHRQLLI